MTAPGLSCEHVLNCQIHEWYPAHKRWTIKSRFLNLSPEFVAYLNQDGLFLPPGAELKPLHGRRRDDDSASESESSWESDSYDADDTTAEPTGESSHDQDGAALPEFDEVGRIGVLIQELGGAIFPKLNWSAPKDAAWISCTGTLKCFCPSDVLLLLKASEFIQHDLALPFEACCDECNPPSYKLCLRQWAYVAPSREFRCFVMGQRLAAISQRDDSNFYPDLVRDGVDLQRRIEAFFNDRIYSRFPNDDYVFDVCFNSDDDVFLVDFNPFSPVTDALLFDWLELYDWRRPPLSVEFRIRTSQPAMTPTPTMSYGFPKDAVHVRSSAEIEEFVNSTRSLTIHDNAR